MAAECTPKLIPLCHPLSIRGVEWRLTSTPAGAARHSHDCARHLTYRSGNGSTTAVSVAALTVDDMCKAVDRGMSISNIALLHNAGGKSGESSVHDPSGDCARQRQAVARRARGRGRACHWRGAHRPRHGSKAKSIYRIVPDEEQLIGSALIHLSERTDVDMILTTGGTGLAPRD